MYNRWVCHLKTLKISLRGNEVVVTGEVKKQVDAEKIVLAVANVEGEDTVDNNMSVAIPEPEAKYHTVVTGNWLSKIADKYMEMHKNSMSFLKQINRYWNILIKFILGRFREFLICSNLFLTKMFQNFEAFFLYSLISLKVSLIPLSK